MRYRTIVADPPWHYDGFAGSIGYGGHFAGQAEQAQVQITPLPYPSMTLDEIAALPVASMAEPDAWLWLWTTNRYLFDAKRIAGDWGFEYAQTIVWRKTSNVPPFGGTFGPNHAEFLLACRRGKPRVIRRWPGSVVEAPKPNAEHSRKPDVFLDLIERSTDGPRLEMFARRARFGWDYWGDESLETATLGEPCKPAVGEQGMTPATRELFEMLPPVEAKPAFDDMPNISGPGTRSDKPAIDEIRPPFYEGCARRGGVCDCGTRPCAITKPASDEENNP